MKAKLLFIFAVYLAGVHGCRFNKKPGLLLNQFRDGSTNILVSTGRQTNTTDAFATDSVGPFNFIYPMDMMDGSSLNYFIRVCENGYLEFAETQANLAACKTAAADVTTGIDATLGQAIAIADFYETTVGTPTFHVDAYHIRRSDQYDASNNVTGPSHCDLQIIAGIISDCERQDRYNITVMEALVVTWRINNTATPTLYEFQAIVAVADNNRTFVAFLYDNANTPGIAKGIIHAKNSALTSSNVRRSEICGATSNTMIHMQSNCECAQYGHYVFETSENVPMQHGFCGTEAGTTNCTFSQSTSNRSRADSMTISRNCRYPLRPTDSCDNTYWCSITTGYRLVVNIKNYAGQDRAMFLNYTIFTEADGLTGFEAPLGNNTVALPLGCGGEIPIESKNNNWTEIVRTDGPTDPNLCFEYDSTANTYSFVLLIYNSVDGINITTDGSRIVVGTCDLDDLSRTIQKNITAEDIQTSITADDIAKTTVPPRTGESVTLSFWSSRNESIKQVFTSSDVVQRGRYIFPAICFTSATEAIECCKGSCHKNKTQNGAFAVAVARWGLCMMGWITNMEYTDKFCLASANVDNYGAYPTYCEFANNAMFMNSGDNNAITAIMEGGCLPPPPMTPTPLDRPPAGRLLEPFKIYPDSRTDVVKPLCMTTSFTAFRWNVLIPASNLYMRCRVKTCVNQQIFRHSKCFDSCSNTLVNANTTDDDDRRRRDVDDEIEVMASIRVVDFIETTEEPRAAKECVDDVMAKGVIGALVALLVLATIMTIILYCVLQKQKQC